MGQAVSAQDGTHPKMGRIPSHLGHSQQSLIMIVLTCDIQWLFDVGAVGAQPPPPHKSPPPNFFSVI